MKVVGQVNIKVEGCEYSLAVLAGREGYFYSTYGYGVDEALIVRSIAEEGELNHKYLEGPFNSLEELLKACKDGQNASEVKLKLY